jgi:predicted nucleotidyltransferase
VPGVVSAYLFGSRATGTGHRESDIDVGVLLDRTIHGTPQARFDARITLITHLGHVLNTNAIDVVVLNDAPPHIVRRVMIDGRPIRCVDPELDHAVRRTALLRAADLEPFLRRTRQIKLQSIAR